MRKFLFAFTVACLSQSVSASTCPLPPLQSKTLPYREGLDVPVITGPYQFNLPSRPTTLLAFDGVMAVFPGKSYISYQLVSDKRIAEMLTQLTSRTISAAEVDRYLYGVSPLHDLNEHDQKLISDMRSDLHLDCHSQLTLYTIESVDVIFQEATLTDPEYRMLFFTGNSTHLISVKGTEKQALAVLQSIKKRKL